MLIYEIFIKSSAAVVSELKVRCFFRDFLIFVFILSKGYKTTIVMCKLDFGIVSSKILKLIKKIYFMFDMAWGLWRFSYRPVVQ